MMAVRTSVYNSPEIANAMSQLAGLFAPPSAADTANYAQAGLTNQKKEQLAQLFANPNDPNFDRRNIAVGNYAPTQSYYAQDQNTATDLAKNAADNARAIETNTLDNQTRLALPRFSPLDQGQVLPAVDPTLASQFGLPATLAPVQGNPKPLSETEVKGWLLQSQIPNLTSDQTTALVMGSTPTQNIVDPTTQKPVVSYNPTAVGQEPFVKTGAEAKPENGIGMLANGEKVTAIQGDDGRWYNAQTKELLPDDTQIFKLPTPQGTASDVGLGKPTLNYIDRALLDIAVAKDTAVKLRDLIASAPASQGAVGWLRGTAQNVLQVGGELGSFFGGRVAEITKDIETGAADAGLAGAFDPNIPAIDMLANLLSFQYAKTTTGERISNQMLKAARTALGLDGLDANQASSIARLNQAISQIQSQEEILKRAKSDGVDSLSAPAGDVAASAELPTPATQEEFDALQPGDHYIDPDDGQEYVK